MNIVWLALRFNISSGVYQKEGVLGEQKCGSVEPKIEAIRFCSPKYSALSTNKP